ncbi:Receptor-like protein kinase HAIKU2 [Hordeum vulgare]|nr:Receptor-like protein kinase HAIKU2 [Hordeum vulgare]
MAPLVVQHRPFICSSRRVVTPPIDYNEQGIIENLTQNNQRSMWASRRIGEDEKVYLIHVQGTAGIGLPTTLVVKKFQNVNRCRSEMLLLATVRHENIINVLHVIERDEVSMLVYKYEVNGSLAYWLHRREGAGRPLSWPERRGIAIGVAKGLRHLHQGCNSQFVHHNINPSNILLDLDFNAKIASFGAAQVNMAGHGQPLRIPQFPFGNFGYAAPEYGIAPSQLTEKVDVYSFGVVLLELVTGRAANGAGPGGQLAMWARNNCNDLMANHLKRFKTEVDMEIPDQARYMKEMAAVFSLGVDCTVWDPQQRPSMRRALKRLRRSRRYSLWA